MSIMVAPYNDSMRLGMGFNSYTQTMCIDKAVVFSDKQVVRAENPSQVVTYSSKCVTRLSDIVKSMNVSYSTSIKKGTVEVAGSSNTINEDKIKESDINAVVSVKVVNQTTIVDESCVFKPVDGIFPGSPEFNDRFGDCYISGFIEGGDFNGIVSMKVLDRTKTDEVTSKIKKGLSSGGESSEFTLDLDSFSGSSGSSNSDIGKETEATVSVAWMGGGQIKDPKAPWNMNSVLSAAAEFPSRVAQVPQKTWAILTKYNANRSFVEWSSKLHFSPLEYDSIASYTAELFDNYMEYKQLLKSVQDMIASPNNYYAQAWKTNSIPLVVPTLIAVKAAFRIEMSKIVQAVDVLSRDPHCLKKNTSLNAEPADELVRRIVKQAQDGTLGSGIAPVSAPTTVPALPASQDLTSAAPPTASVAAPVPAGAAVPPASDAAAPAASSSAVVNAQSQPTFDPKAMVAPEIWSDLLPLPVDQNKAAAPGAISTMPSSLASFFPPPPTADQGDLAIRGGKVEAPIAKLTILSAVCGIADVTDSIQAKVKDNQLAFQGSMVQGLLDGHPKLTVDRWGRGVDIHINLAFVYRFGDSGPIRVCIAKQESASGSTDTTTVYKITKDSTDFPEVKPTAWNADTWSITAFIYGAKLYNDSDHIAKLQNVIRTNWNGGKGERCLGDIDDTWIGEDPWYGRYKTSIVFYQAAEGGVMKAAVGVQANFPGVMTDRLSAHKVSAESIGVNKLPPGMTPKVSRISTSNFRLEQCGGVDEPFLEFANGIRFCFQPDGNFCVYKHREFKWGSMTVKPNGQTRDMTGCVLQWQGDNKLCSYNNADGCFMCLNAGAIVDNKNFPGEIVFQDSPPYIEMGYYGGDGMWQRTWSI